MNLNKKIRVGKIGWNYVVYCWNVLIDVGWKTFWDPSHAKFTMRKHCTVAPSNSAWKLERCKTARFTIDSFFKEKIFKEERERERGVLNNFLISL